MMVWAWNTIRRQMQEEKWRSDEICRWNEAQLTRFVIKALNGQPRILESEHHETMSWKEQRARVLSHTAAATFSRSFPYSACHYEYFHDVIYEDLVAFCFIPSLWLLALFNNWKEDAVTKTAVLCFYAFPSFWRGSPMGTSPFSSLHQELITFLTRGSPYSAWSLMREANQENAMINKVKNRVRRNLYARRRRTVSSVCFRLYWRLISKMSHFIPLLQ